MHPADFPGDCRSFDITPPPPPPTYNRSPEPPYWNVRRYVLKTKLFNKYRISGLTVSSPSDYDLRGLVIFPRGLV